MGFIKTLGMRKTSKDYLSRYSKLKKVDIKVYLLKFVHLQGFTDGARFKGDYTTTCIYYRFLVCVIYLKIYNEKVQNLFGNNPHQSLEVKEPACLWRTLHAAALYLSH